MLQNDVIKCCKMMSPHSNEPATWKNCVSRRHFYYFIVIKKLLDCVKAKGFIFVSSGQPSHTKVSNNSLCEPIKQSIHSQIAEAEEDNPSTLYIIFVYFDASVKEALGVDYIEWQYML